MKYRLETRGNILFLQILEQSPIREWQFRNGNSVIASANHPALHVDYLNSLDSLRCKLYVRGADTSGNFWLLVYAHQDTGRIQRVAEIIEELIGSLQNQDICLNDSKFQRKDSDETEN